MLHLDVNQDFFVGLIYAPVTEFPMESNLNSKGFRYEALTSKYGLASLFQDNINSYSNRLILTDMQVVNQ